MKSIAFVASFFTLAALAAIAQPAPPLTLRQTIVLPGVMGKFDHFAIDLSCGRLFAAATGNHSVEVINLKTGKVEQSITGLGKPHGLAWVASTHTLYVADGTLSELQKYDGAPLTLSGKLRLSDDTDDLVYDEAAHLLFVGHGGTNPANPARVAVVDTASFQLRNNITVATHPEALDIDPAGQRIFANIADSSEIAVIDGKAQSGDGILAHWKLTKAADNVPLAWNADDHVLYVACRTPATLIALNAESGQELYSITTIGGADDLFYDQARHRVYVIGGSGGVEIFQVGRDQSPRSLGTIHTAEGAKTGLYVPSQSLLYVGIPGVEGHPAEIRIYSADRKESKP